MLALLHHIHESRCALGVARSKDTAGTQRTGQEHIAVGLEDHGLGNGLGLRVGLNEGLGNGVSLVRVDEGRTIGQNTGRGGIDQAADLLGQAGVDHVLGALDVDLFEGLGGEVVRRGGDVHADMVALEGLLDGLLVGDVAREVGDAVSVGSVGGDEDVEDSDVVVCALDQFGNDPSSEEAVSSGDNALCGHDVRLKCEVEWRGGESDEWRNEMDSQEAFFLLFGPFSALWTDQVQTGHLLLQPISVRRW